MKKRYIEPYSKENNLLQLPLFFFGKRRPKKTTVEWSNNGDECKLECHSNVGVPGSFEQDVYAASMRIFVKEGMPLDGIKLNYSDIARELNLDHPKYYVGQIKKALERLGLSRYKFTRCFLEAGPGKPKQIDAYFSLFDSAYLFRYKKGENSKKSSESRLVFPMEVRKNLEANFYQFLDMAWYKSLPEGLPRRLYEYLAKREYHANNNIFQISEKLICRWLPISDKNITNRRKRLEDISFILVKAGYLKDYSFDKKKKICIFTYASCTTFRIDEDSPVTEISSATQMKPELIIDAKRGYDFTVEVVPSISQPNTNEEKELYWAALQWIETIKYFHIKRKKEISDMPISDIARVYKGIRQEYESKEKKPSAGWVYKAFTEGWEFAEKSELPETPEGKRAKKAKEIFESWNVEEQDSFMQELRDYIGPSMEEDKVEEFIQSEKVWFSWAPMLMAAKGISSL